MVSLEDGPGVGRPAAACQHEPEGQGRRGGEAAAHGMVTVTARALLKVAVTALWTKTWRL
jgi:hypothetical protein